MEEKTGQRTLEDLVGNLPRFNVVTRNARDQAEYDDKRTIYGVRNLGDLYRDVMKRIGGSESSPEQGSPSNSAQRPQTARTSFSRAETSGTSPAGPHTDRRNHIGSSGPLRKA